MTRRAPEEASPSGERAPRDPSLRESPSPRLDAIVDRISKVWGRCARAWRGLSPDRRLAGLTAVGLFLTLFLPWYQETVIARGVTSLRSLSDTLTGWGAFSVVEAVILLICAGVLVLLFLVSESEDLRLPGGDGTVIAGAGGLSCLLIVWRMFDKEGTTGHHLYTTTSGIEWGIFVAFALAGLLTYFGMRIRRGDASGQAERGREHRRPVPRDEAPAAAAVSSSAPPAPPAPATAPPAARRYEPFDMDETWIQVEHGTTQPPATEPSPEPDGARTAPTHPEPRRRSDPGAATRRRPRSLGRLGELDISDPPTSPLRPSRLTGRRAEPAVEREPEEPLTLRLDRPD